MTIKFQCPHCGVAIHAPAAAVGRRGTCKKCKQQLTVPTAFDSAPMEPVESLMPTAITPPAMEVPAEPKEDPFTFLKGTRPPGTCREDVAAETATPTGVLTASEVQPVGRMVELIELTDAWKAENRLRPFAETQGTVGCLLAAILCICVICAMVLTDAKGPATIITAAAIGLSIFIASLIVPITLGRPRFIAAQTHLQKKREQFAQVRNVIVSTQPDKKNSTCLLSPIASVVIPPVCIGCVSPHVNETIQIYAPSAFTRIVVWGSPMLGATVAVALFGRSYYRVGIASLLGSIVGIIVSFLYSTFGTLIRPPLRLYICQECFTRFVAEKSIVRRNRDPITLRPPTDTALFALKFDNKHRLLLTSKSSLFGALFQVVNSKR